MSGGHVALVGYPGFGHLKPTFGLVSELLRRGHRITYVVTDHYADVIADLGARVVRYHSAIPDVTLTQREIDNHAIALSMMRETWAPAPAAVRYFDTDPPDLVMHDSLSIGTARLLRTRYGVPLGCNHTVFANPGLPEPADVAGIDAIAPEFSLLYKEIWDELRPLGVGNLFEVYLSGSGPELNLAYLPAAFQLDLQVFDDTFRFVGPCLPPSPPRVVRGGVPEVLVSLGTTPSDHAEEFLRTCVRAATGMPWRMTVTLAGRLDTAALGDLPANVRAHRWLDQADALRGASAFVTHAGMGGLMEAFANGVPVLAAPDTVEQRVNAMRAEQLGLGRVLSGTRAEVTPERMREDISVLIADTEVRERLEWIRREIDACGGATEAADAVEALLSGGDQRKDRA
ncbi:MGT family glycosyltransferase [Herbihabitans rhizosphaerae]|uniref:MGT family glycosyltransferase n=1 Tax=Herbihabitans rhizosphaerae TaxID=1872711 RepID=A0A4Q7KKM3_9PSEU|nr:macrolide family glycosyltransferase [Herbihabitans rhizosphaerae]RZS36430.1 MGT family glycosyltransferase [Herbihabitans rhizosphaerae]